MQFFKTQKPFKKLLNHFYKGKNLRYILKPSFTFKKI